MVGPAQGATRTPVTSAAAALRPAFSPRDPLHHSTGAILGQLVRRADGSLLLDPHPRQPLVCVRVARAWVDARGRHARPRAGHSPLLPLSRGPPCFTTNPPLAAAGTPTWSRILRQEAIAGTSSFDDAQELEAYFTAWYCTAERRTDDVYRPRRLPLTADRCLFRAGTGLSPR